MAAFEHRAAALTSAMAASSAAKMSRGASHFGWSMTCVGVPFKSEKVKLENLKPNWRSQIGEVKLENRLLPELQCR
jgi:hypothetical protein